MPRAVVASFFDLWTGHRDMHEGIRAIWPSLVREHFAKRHWKSVAGPIAAACATLRDAGWTPAAPDFYLDGDGGRWQLVGEGLCEDFFEHFDKVNELRLWQQASHHVEGSGLQGGVC